MVAMISLKTFRILMEYLQIHIIIMSFSISMDGFQYV